MKTIIRELRHQDLSKELFSDFKRYQEISRCWKKHDDGCLVLEEEESIRDWSETDLYYMILDLHRTIGMKGNVSGLFEDDRLLGFFSLESHLFGSRNQYIQLSHLHISRESRRQGLGSILFDHACSIAREYGAEKLYLSAVCSHKTITFYCMLGCYEAEEYDRVITERDPFNIQMEYRL